MDDKEQTTPEPVLEQTAAIAILSNKLRLLQKCYVCLCVR